MSQIMSKFFQVRIFEVVTIKIKTRIMANLNIPFLLLDKDSCEFKPAVTTSTLIHNS